MWCISHYSSANCSLHFQLVSLPHLHELGFSVVKCPSLKLKSCWSSGYWFSPRKYVASGIYPLTSGTPSPVTNKYCFLLLPLSLVKAAFRPLQTLGAVPVAGFLHASSSYETKENAKWTVSLCGWKPPTSFQVHSKLHPRRYFWVVWAAEGPGGRHKGVDLRCQSQDLHVQFLSTKLMHSSSFSGVERHGQGSHEEPRFTLLRNKEVL